MLQVRFRNLAPCEQVVEAAREGYEVLRREAGSAQDRVRCYVTVRLRDPQRGGEQRFQVELAVLDDDRTLLRTKALGEDPGVLVGSSMMSAAMVGAVLSSRPALSAVPARSAGPRLVAAS